MTHPPQPETGLTFNEVAHTYHYDGIPVPGVTTVLSLIDGMTSVPPDRLMAAGVRGTIVHRATENYDNGLAWDETITDDIVREEVWPYVSAYFQFLRDAGDAYAIETIEQRVFHKKHHYAGTCDRIAIVDGQRSVIDLKTSTRLNIAVGPQLAAYKAAHNCELPTKQRAIGRYALQLKKDGTYHFARYDEEHDLIRFLVCLDFWRLRDELGIGPPKAQKSGSYMEPTDGNNGWWPTPVEHDRGTRAFVPQP